MITHEQYAKHLRETLEMHRAHRERTFETLVKLREALEKAERRRFRFLLAWLTFCVVLWLALVASCFFN